MEWAPILHLVSLLETYLLPEPRIASFVRAQLITTDQKDDMTTAIRKAMKLWHDIETPYDALLNHTGLDWKNNSLVTQVLPDLRLAMFDVTLGRKNRQLLLNRYSEVHLARSCIETFITGYSKDLKDRPTEQALWWDGVDALGAPHSHWVPRGVGEDKIFRPSSRAGLTTVDIFKAGFKSTKEPHFSATTGGRMRTGSSQKRPPYRS